MLMDLLVMADALLLVDGSVSMVVVLHLQDFESPTHHLEVIVNVL
jgi:hypothetical protein